MDKKNLRILELFETHGQLSSRSIGELENMGNVLIAEKFSYFHKLGYIDTVMMDNDNYMNDAFRISDQGRGFLEEYRREHKRYIRSVVHWWINTAIAVSALIISLVSIILQL